MAARPETLGELAGAFAATLGFVCLERFEIATDETGVISSFGERRLVII